MSSQPDFLSRLSSAWQRHWAEIMAADSAADASMEPELPASVFVHSPLTATGPVVQAGVKGAAVRQRSASRSTSNG